jgi:hypothetical protein
MRKTRENETAGSRPQFLTCVHFSYNIGSLRCFPALSLYASFIRDHRARGQTPREPIRMPGRMGTPGSFSTGEAGSDAQPKTNSETCVTIRTRRQAQSVGGWLARNHYGSTGGKGGKGANLSLTAKHALPGAFSASPLPTG